MEFRRARPGEADVLTRIALRSKQSWGYSDEFMENVRSDMVVHPQYLEEEHGIVAEENGAILGYAIVRVNGDAAFLRDLFIEPANFGKGVGKRLFEAALEYARARGATALTLISDPNAVGFYRKFGMRHIGDEPSIAGKGRTLPVLRLILRPRPSPF